MKLSTREIEVSIEALLAIAEDLDKRAHSLRRYIDSKEWSLPRAHLHALDRVDEASALAEEYRDTALKMKRMLKRGVSVYG